MSDISGFGVQVTIKASQSFPSGFTVTQFSDDADAVDTPSIQIMDKAMGLNGDPVFWSKASIIPLTLNVIPGTDDDRNLAVLLENNRVGKGKQSVRDEITMTVTYPNGRKTTFSDGRITDGMTSNSVASAGRLKTKPYIFGFGNKVEA